MKDLKKDIKEYLSKAQNALNFFHINCVKCQNEHRCEIVPTSFVYHARIKLFDDAIIFGIDGKPMCKNFKRGSIDQWKS